MSPVDPPSCLAVCGLAPDATPREIHVLFSGCGGFLRCRLVLAEAAGLPYGLAEFDSEDSASRAADARRGTTWEEGAAPVSFHVGSREELEKVAQQVLLPAGVSPRPAQAEGEAAPVSAATSPRSPRSAHFPLSMQQDSEGRAESSTHLASAQSSVELHSERSDASRSQAWVVQRRLQAAVASRKVADLDLALAEGEATGLNQDELHQAEQALAVQRRKREVREAATAEQQAMVKLAQAKALVDEEADIVQHTAGLQQALAAARAAAEQCASTGLRQGERKLRRAAQALEEAWRGRAKADLQQALAEGGVEVLRAALEVGTAAGLGREAGVKGVVARQTLEEARLGVAEEQGRLQAQARLEAFLEGACRAGPLRAAVEEARSYGVPGSVLQRGEKALTALEHRAAIRWGLVAAMVQARAGSSLEPGALGIMRLRLAHVEARSAGLAARELANVQDFLSELLARAAASSRHARSRRRAQASEGLAAVLAGEQQAVLLQQLPKAIQDGRRANLEKSTLNQASRKLIQAQLERAAGQRDVAALPLAIRAARQLGLEVGVIETAAKVLLEEELLPSLQASIDCGDLAGLERSIMLWNEKGLDKTMLEHLVKLHQKLRREPKEVRERLDRVFQSPIEFEVESADFTAEGRACAAFAAEVLAPLPHIPLSVESFLCRSESSSRNTCAKRAEAVRTTLQRAGCRNQIVTYAWGHSHPQIKASIVRIMPREADLCAKLQNSKGVGQRCESARELQSAGRKGDGRRAGSLSPRRWRL